MQFQNTLAYITTNNDGGSFRFVKAIQPFAFSPDTTLSLLSKDIVSNVIENINIQVKETGAYFIDFSFIAQSSEQVNFQLGYIINDNPVDLYTSQFMVATDRSVNARVEVSSNFIIDLKYNDTILPFLKILSGTLKGEFFTTNIKFNAINLQQLGIH